MSKTNASMDKTEIDNFYASVPMNDLELLVGPTLARSRSNSPVQGEHKSENESHFGKNINIFVRGIKCLSNFLHPYLVIYTLIFLLRYIHLEKINEG